ncbi:hypothetical protein EDD70_3008 [Hydrogenoanaerobacterium saccharovorans]|uniref:Uncharacterized protein n=1 Tax=Hydrogenoanaerobacterium saccharovorans TaxID=474960 RepID=A0A1H8EJ30_9FIRM|nr:hypothetical protein [Hydrogenoanaerobacterium saccharovorans]RPF41882.1 hypothetical protein EDD70_3008 [Hydrogenoanaerobacterium saccharovorans]SEN19144.1 hypothetical protein SAMN05216180_3028 [Hydrogenoanaerobacterium saccharovorans]
MKKFFSFLVLLVVFFCFSVTAFAVEPPRGFHYENGKTHFNPLVFSDDKQAEMQAMKVLASFSNGRNIIAIVDEEFLYMYECTYYDEKLPTARNYVYQDRIDTWIKMGKYGKSYCFKIRDDCFEYVSSIAVEKKYTFERMLRKTILIKFGSYGQVLTGIPGDLRYLMDFDSGTILGDYIQSPKVYSTTEFKITNDFNSELDKYKVKSMQLSSDVSNESIAKREIINLLYEDEKLKGIADFTVSEKDISFVRFVPPKNATKDDVTFKDGAFIADITLHVGTLTTQIKGVLGSITALEYKPAFDGKAPSAVIMANWLQALYSILVPCVIVGSALYCILTCVKIIPSSILKFTK